MGIVIPMKLSGLDIDSFKDQVAIRKFMGSKRDRNEVYLAYYKDGEGLALYYMVSEVCSKIREDMENYAPTAFCFSLPSIEEFAADYYITEVYRPMKEKIEDSKLLRKF